MDKNLVPYLVAVSKSKTVNETVKPDQKYTIIASNGEKGGTVIRHVGEDTRRVKELAAKYIAAGKDVGVIVREADPRIGETFWHVDPVSGKTYQIMRKGDKVYRKK